MFHRLEVPMSKMKIKVLFDVNVSGDFGQDISPCVCAYPLTTVTADGGLVCLYRRGREKHSYDGVLLSQRSSDGAATWQGSPIQMWDSDREQIVAEPVESLPGKEGKSVVWEALKDFTFGTPDLVALPDGAIILTYYAAINGVTHIRACRFELTLD